MALEIITSNKGKRKLCVGGHMYTVHRESGDSILWKCTQRSSRHCKGSVTTDVLCRGVVSYPQAHNHAPDTTRVRVAQVRARMSEQARNSNVDPSQIYAECVANGDHEILAALPSESNLKRTIRRQRPSLTTGQSDHVGGEIGNQQVNPLDALQIQEVDETNSSTTNGGESLEEPHYSDGLEMSLNNTMNDSINNSSMNDSLNVSSMSMSGTGEEDGQPCKVCGDRSSGLHYGVTSCEGCKGFFRRSIQKQIDYRCMRNGQCDVNRASRNRCQYCRFKKCLAVGMSKDSVRYGRIPRRMKSDSDVRLSAPGDASAGGAHASAPLTHDRELAIYDVILTVSQAHHTHCMTTQDKVNVMKRHSMSLCQVTSSSYDEQRCGMWQTLAEQVSPAVQRLVEFSKHVPGFPELSQDDQLILIKSSFFDMWLASLACVCGAGEAEDVFTLSDGLQLPRVEIETIYSVEFVESMFTFARTFNALKLSDTEIGLFTAIVLTSADRSSLSDPKKVEKIQDRLIEALNLQITRYHPNETALFGNVLMKLPDLRTIGANHNRELEFYRSNWDKLRLPPLVAEIYDIPKLETSSDTLENGND